MQQIRSRVTIRQAVRRKIVALLVAAVGLVGPGVLTLRGWPTQARPDHPGAIALTSRVISSRFCSADDEVDVWQLTLELRATNTSQTPVVRLAGVNVGSFEIAPSIDDLDSGEESRKFVLAYDFYVPANRTGDLRAPPAGLRLLAPGRSTELNAGVWTGGFFVSVARTESRFCSVFGKKLFSDCSRPTSSCQLVPRVREPIVH